MSTVRRKYLADLGTSRPTSMIPVAFAGCFGWLHPPLDGRASHTAVLLCPGLKTDGANGYRPFRLLANALASAGYPTLRFGYPGTGDSCDPETDEHLAVWQQSIHSAVDWLRRYTGADQVVLCGLRFGAALAATVAAEREDVSGLVLLAPVLRGRSYIRQLTVEVYNRSSDPPHEIGLVSHDLRLSAETVRLISQIDLRRVALRPGCQVAVFSKGMPPVVAECIEFWRSCRAEVVHDEFGGLEPMLRPSYASHEPPADVSRIVAWLRRSQHADPAPLLAAFKPPRAELRPAGCVETPLQFGADRNLFGMLCCPADGGEPDLAIVIGNSGGDPHYGGARASVGLARWFAAHGITSLRMDFAGLGDSVAPDDAETHVYETDRRPDISAAIDALNALGYQRYAVQGLCSGAFHAFHAALNDPRICVLLLIDMPLFQWRWTQTTSRFLGKLVRVDTWKIALDGELDLRARILMQCARLTDITRKTLRRLASLSHFGSSRGFAQASLNRLSRHARTLLLYSEGDQGLAVLAEELGHGVMPMGTSVEIVPDIDHNLTNRDMQHSVAERIMAFLAPDLVALPASEALQLRHEVANSTGIGGVVVVGVAAEHQPVADQPLA